jgi:hypothetical protein
VVKEGNKKIIVIKRVSGRKIPRVSKEGSSIQSFRMLNRFRVAVKRENRKRTVNVEVSSIGAKSLQSFKERRGPGENNIAGISRKVSINGNTVRKRVLWRTERDEMRKVSIGTVKLFSEINVFPIIGDTEIVEMIGNLDASKERSIGGILASKYIAFGIRKLMGRIIGRAREKSTKFRETTHILM